MWEELFMVIETIFERFNVAIVVSSILFSCKVLSQKNLKFSSLFPNSEHEMVRQENGQRKKREAEEESKSEKSEMRLYLSFKFNIIKKLQGSINLIIIICSRASDGSRDEKTVYAKKLLNEIPFEVSAGPECRCPQQSDDITNFYCQLKHQWR